MGSATRKCTDCIISGIALRGFVVATTSYACRLVTAVCGTAFPVVPVSASLSGWVLGSGTCCCPARHVPGIVICHRLAQGSIGVG